MADHSPLTSSALYLAILTALNGRLDDAVKMLAPTYTTPTNIPANAFRFNDTTFALERWNGSAWIVAARALSSVNSTAQTALGISTFVKTLLALTTDSAVRGAIGLTGFPAYNYITNGGFAVDQRNNGGATTFVSWGGALYHCVDSWYGYCTGANVVGQRVAGVGQSQYRYRFTGAAGVTGVGFGHRISADDSYQLNGKSVTLSASIANSLLTTVTWTAYYATTTDAFGSLAAPTKTQIATGTWTVTSSTVRYSATLAIPAAANKGVEVVFSVGAQTSGSWWISEVQLELGAIATPFIAEAYILTLLKCKARYQRLAAYGVKWFPPSTAQSQIWITPIPPMRAMPVVGTFGGAPTLGNAFISGSYAAGEPENLVHKFVVTNSTVEVSYVVWDDTSGISFSADL